MTAMTGKPITVFPDQDHDAHIKVHTAFMQDPVYQQFMSQNPNAQAFAGAMQQHLAEHFALSYRRQLELKLGVSLPQQGEQLPPDIQNDVAKLASVAADRLLQQHNQEQALAKQQQEENDPLTIMQREELRIKEEAVKVKAAEAAADAKYKEDKIALETAKVVGQAGEPLRRIF